MGLAGLLHARTRTHAHTRGAARTMSQPFAWSYSALKNFETCAKRFYHYNVAKDVKEPETEQLRAGNQLHAHFEARVVRGTSLPLGYGQYEKMLAAIIAAPGHTYGEQKLAITADFQPVAFFGGARVWFRTVLDLAKIRDDHTATVFDYKTGRPNPDTTQLQLMAATLFVHDPKLERVKAGLLFVAHDQVERAEFVRDDLVEIWGEILPRVRAIERARDAKEYPPKPGGLCKRYCAVISCPYHGN